MSPRNRRTREEGGPSDEPAIPDHEAIDTEYRVGPGRPPKEHQLKPGRSGNPKGAKRKPPSIVPDVRKCWVRKLEIGFEQLANLFAKGDRHARRDVFDLAGRFGINLLAGQGPAAEADRQVISVNDQALLADFVSRHQTRIGQPSDETSSNARNPQVEEDGAVGADPTKNDPDEQVR